MQGKLIYLHNIWYNKSFLEIPDTIYRLDGTSHKIGDWEFDPATDQLVDGKGGKPLISGVYRAYANSLRIITEAKLAITAKNKLKDNFNKAAKKIATETKSTITSINSQMDTAIQGKVRKSLEEKIPNMLLKYDEI